MEIETKGIQQKTCPECGTTLEEFKSNNKPGCPECYRIFSQEIDEFIQKHQGYGRHVGKRPKC